MVNIERIRFFISFSWDLLPNFKSSVAITLYTASCVPGAMQAVQKLVFQNGNFNT